MSLVYITYHNENIFDVEKNLGVRMPRGDRYVSKFKRHVCEQLKKPHVIEMEDGKKLLTSSNKCQHKTMGYAETPLEPPCNFLRKQRGVKWQRLNEHSCPTGSRMPPVPRFVRSKPTSITSPAVKPKKETVRAPDCPHRRFFKNHKHRANFISVNIERIKKAETKRPPPRYIDTPTGARHDLLNTGLIPQWVCHKNFGKVPCYLRVQQHMLQNLRERCKIEQQKAEDRCNAYVTPGIRQLQPKERLDILAGLKTNFAELTKVYQGLSLYTDTIAKKLRKGKLEKDLRQLEQDIYLMENNSVIYVSEY